MTRMVTLRQETDKIANKTAAADVVLHNQDGMPPELVLKAQKHLASVLDS